MGLQIHIKVMDSAINAIEIATVGNGYSQAIDCSGVWIKEFRHIE